MGTADTFRANLIEANPRLAMVKDGATSIPALDCRMHKTTQPLPAVGETELGRFVFFGRVSTGVDKSSGYPMRMVVGPTASIDSDSDTVSASLVHVVDGGGILVVTDRRLLGTAFGESSLVDARPGSGNNLYFSMAYEDIEQFTLNRKTSMLGGTKERSMTALGLNPMGAMNIEVDGTLTLHADSARQQKLRSARGLFETASRAAARHRLAADPSEGERRQLEAVLAGHYTTDGQDLVADLIDPDA